MNKKTKPDIDKSKLGTNPFIYNQVIKARSFDKSTAIVILTINTSTINLDLI